MNKTMLPAITCLLIVATLATTFPIVAFAQTDFLKQVSKANAPSDLKSTVYRFQQKRSDNLLNNPTVDTENYDFTEQSQRSNSAGTQRKSWTRRNWWIFPVLAGVGVGIYFLAKNNSSSGILCRDGTISNAQNTQGACSHHGGIARQTSY